MVTRLSSGKMFAIRVIFLALTLSLLGPVRVHAQVAGGTITGVVSDTSGAPMPNVQLSIRDVATGVARTVSTDAAGLYAAPNLLAGNYEITTSAPGFATVVRSSITLTVGEQKVLNITMRVGEVTQNIEITGEAPNIELASSTISGVVNATTVRELPLNGRDWTQLAALQPGVISTASLQPVADAQGSRFFKGLGNQMSISGTRSTQNSYRIDGINVNDYANGGPSNVQGAATGVDAIQEFSVLTSNYTAEYGRTSGGVINAVTRSGTNQFHGGAYEFLRNSALDAPNFFDNFSNRPKPPFRRNQFGAAAGGPIWKDRTFVFGDYEGLRQSLGASEVDTVPSPDARNGIIHNADGTTTAIGVDPKVKPYLALWPLPNAGLLAPGNTGVWAFAGNQATTENFGSARVDHKISEKDNLFGSVIIERSTLAFPAALDTIVRGITTARDFVALGETHTFSSQLVNSLRVGLNRNVATLVSLSAINPLAADTSLGIIPGQDSPWITVSGVAELSGGVNTRSQQAAHLNSMQGYDDASLIKGKHDLKFGFAVERIQTNVSDTGSRGGMFSFGSFTDFLTNKPTSFAIENYLPGTITGLGVRQSIYGAYVQDDIHWRSNLTVNLGLRYEMSTVPTEVHGHLASLINIYGDPTLHVGNPLFSNPTDRNFEPKFGFAWDPFHNGKTSIRGAFGVFDDLPLFYEYVKAANTAPFFPSASASNLSPGSFPLGAFSQIVGAPKAETAYIEPKPHRAYVMTWNLSLQRQLIPNLTAMIGYVGSHGVHIPFRANDVNDVLPTLTPAGYLWPFPAASGTVINPTVGRLDATLWSNSTSYQGLQTQLTKRMSHGVQIQGSYTWSKAIDDGAGSNTVDPYPSSISSLFFFDPKTRRAVTEYNIGQNLVVNYTWIVPSPKSLHGPAAWAVNGWQLGGVLTVQSGPPFTPLVGGDPLGLNNNDPFAYPDRLSGPGCQSLVNPGNVNNYLKLNCFAVPMATPSIAAQCTPFSAVPGSCANLLGNSGRNDVNGPGLVNLDFSLFKNNYIRRLSESFNVQFRAELFNVLNRANFAPPIDNSFLFDSTGAPVGGAGLIDKTTTTAREIQIALKVIW